MDLIQAALKFEVRFQGGVKSRVKLGVGLDSTVYTAMPQPKKTFLRVQGRMPSDRWGGIEA
jgi:hypothetical protein